MVGESGSVLDRFQPFVGGVYAGNFHCQVGKPAVRRGAVPVLDAGGNIDDISGQDLHRLFAPLLIEAASGDSDEDLTAALIGMMDMPVVAAVNWTPPPQSLVVASFNGIHICALCESFLTSSFYQVIFLFLPRSKPLLQG